MRARPAGRHSRRRCHRKPVPVLATLLVVAGLALAVYSPVAQALWALNERGEAASRAASTAGTAEADATYEQAVAYNAMLAGGGSDGVLDYAEQLAYGGNDIVAEVEVASVGIQLPVRLGASEDNLSRGAVHVEGTSLPVGGQGTCALAAHSGLASAAMFNRLRDVEMGALVEVSVCGRSLYYEVTAAEVIDPDELDEAIAYVEGQDRLVLFTCTSTPTALRPRGGYGANNLRLVVTCLRTDAPEDDGGEASQWPVWAKAAFAAACALAVAGGGAAARALKRSRRRRKHMAHSANAMARTAGGPSHGHRQARKGGGYRAD